MPVSVPTLTIGDVVFLTDEHPEDLPLGLEQRIVVHEGPGGYRETHVLGPQPMDVTWSGTFWDDQAKSKVAALKALEKSGRTVVLSFDDQRFNALIKRFVPTIKYLARIPYEITVTIADGVRVASVPSIDGKTQSLYKIVLDAKSKYSAVSADTAISGIAALDPSVYSNITVLGTQLNNAGPLASASQSSVSGMLTTITTIQSSLSTYLNALNTAIAAAGATIPASLQQAYTYISDMNAALSLIAQNAQIGQAPKIIQTAGGVSLFHLAAQHYGDSSMATLIKTANGLTSMFVPAGQVKTLKLPPATSAT